MTRNKNLFICGKAGAGKTSCAKYLIDNQGYIASKFAYPVYDIARNYFNMQGKDRALLQFIGTDAGRTIVNSNIWINRMLEDLDIARYTAKKLYNKELLFVSDDVRFINEYYILKESLWTGIYLNVDSSQRDRQLVQRDGSTQSETLNHVSETELDTFKDKLIQLDANCDLETLIQRFSKLVNSL